MSAAAVYPPRNGEGDRAKRGGGGPLRLLRPEVAIARKLRRQMSHPEVLLWQRLRGKASGHKFRKQHPVGPYAADFCCLTARLIVEIDGAPHDGDARQARDRSRQIFMEQNGFRVFRASASDVEQNMDGVLGAIVALVANPLPPSFGRSPSPFRGG